jgi:hypothetical protein
MGNGDEHGQAGRAAARIPEFGSIRHAINIRFSFAIGADTLCSLWIAPHVRLCITSRQTRTMIWHPGNVLMNAYTCKIARSDNFFIGSESADVSGDTSINVISPLAVGYLSRGGMGSAYTVLDPVDRSSNSERSNGACRIRREFEHGDSLILLWADEMVHHAYATIQLTSLLSFRRTREPHAPVRCELECGVAPNQADGDRTSF